MALKRKISKAEFDKLAADVKTEYKADGDNYILDVDGDEDAAALLRAKDREAQGRKDEKARADAAEAKLAELSDGDSRKKNDIETLEKSWKTKLDKAEETAKARIEKLEGAARKSLIDGTANSIAKDISTVPALMQRVLKERMTVDFDGDEPTLRILDASGKVSALTLDDLKKEVIANKEYSGIIIANKASGSSATKETKTDGTTVSKVGDDGKPKSFLDMSPEEQKARIEEKREARINATNP